MGTAEGPQSGHSTVPHQIDVLIPTYNPKREHLIETLESLLAQKYTDWHALIHDDCSDIDTESIVKPFLKDPRITFKKSPVRLGIGGNWNAGLKATTGRFVAYLFQDDLWSPEHLSHAMDILEENPPIGFVSMAHSYLFDGHSPSTEYYERVQAAMKNVKHGPHSGMEMLRRMLECELTPNVIGEPSFVVIRRYIIDAAGPFLEDMPQALDMEEWLRVLRISKWYYAADGEFGSFRVHGGGTSAVNQEAGYGLSDRLRCFQILLQGLRGEDRRLALQSRDRAVQKMIAKFFTRVGGGGAVSGTSRNNLIAYCLRHPLLMTRCFLQYVFS